PTQPASSAIGQPRPTLCSAVTSGAEPSATPIATMSVRGRTLRCRIDRDAVAAERADPERVADFDERRAGVEVGRVRFDEHVAHFERARIDLHGLPALLRLADGVQRAVAGPMNVVDPKSE